MTFLEGPWRPHGHRPAEWLRCLGFPVGVAHQIDGTKALIMNCKCLYTCLWGRTSTDLENWIIAFVKFIWQVEVIRINM